MNWQKYLTGFIIGSGTTAVGLYVYSKKKNEIHDFLKSQGINLPMPGDSSDPGSLSLEELVREKEKLEDIIAEKELAAKEESPAPEKAEKK